MTIAEKLTTIAENEQRVYNAGYNAGKALNYDEGYEAGKQAEYDAFWDGYQENGERKNYNYGFAGYGWTDENFRPAYNINPINITRMFSGTGIKDVKKALEDAGVTLDVSQAVSTSYFMDDYPMTERMPVIDTSSITSLQYFINNCAYLKYIEKIILKADGSQAVSTYTLGNCPSLEEVRFEGVIGKSGLNVQRSTKLSRESIISIINCLSTTTSGLSVTLSKKAVDKAFETSKGANDGSTSKEWMDLLSAYDNWTIALA